MKLLAILLAVAILGGPVGALLAIGLLVIPASGDCAPAPLATSTEAADPDIAETTRIVIPLPAGTWTISDPWGWRDDPFTGEREFHQGTDMAAAEGTPILAATDGVVVAAGPSGEFGNLVVIESTVGGAPVALGYAHIRDGGLHVAAGQTVTAGQEIAEVGMTGYATGPHLHFQVEPGHWGDATVDSWVWLQDHDAEGFSDYTPAARTCV